MTRAPSRPARAMGDSKETKREKRSMGTIMCVNHTIVRSYVVRDVIHPANDPGVVRMGG